jgi:MraZ protein
MFLGEYTHTLDNKGRLTVPAKFRDQLAAGLVVTRNPLDQCLLLMPMPEWMALSARMKELPLANRQSAQLRRILFSAAEDLKPDKQGRILVSPRLRQYAHVGAEVMVVGMDNYLELWDPLHWNDQVIKQLEDGELDDELFSALGI